MRVLLLLFISLSLFIVEAQTDVIVLEPDVPIEFEIDASSLETDIFFDGESDQIVRFQGLTSMTEGYFDVEELIFYTPDGDELMRVSPYYSPDIYLNPSGLFSSKEFQHS